LKIVFTTSELSNALSFLGRIANGRARPILGCVKVSAPSKTGPVTIQVHNGEVWARCTLSQVDVQAEGECAVDAAMFARAVSNSSECSTVTCSLEENKWAVRGDRVVTRVWTQDAKDFPPPIDLGKSVTVGVRAVALREQMDRASGSMDTETGRYAMAGMQLRIVGSKMDLSATDGKIGARCWVPCSKAGNTAAAVLPAASVRLADAALSAAEGDDEAQVTIGGAAEIVLGATEIRTCVMEGAFPPVDDVIPAKSERWIEVDPKALASVTKAGAMFESETGTRSLKITPNGNALSITSGLPESGDFDGRVDAVLMGDPKPWGTQAKYLLEALRTIQTPVVRIEVESPRKPFVVRGDDFVILWMGTNLDG
jgi:DNA polymerase-3 subunit beta